MPEHAIDALVRDESLLVSVVRRYFPEIRPFGRRWVVPRDAAEGHTVALHQLPDGRWKFHRWGHNEYGDVLDVLRWYEPGVATTVDALRVLGALPPPRPLPRRRPQPPIALAPEWDLHGTLSEIESHPQRSLLWTAYKPLEPDDLERWHLGVGPLPGMRLCTHPRLVYPVIEEGRLVAVRGRAMTRACRAACPKWLSARGSRAALWGWDHVNPDFCRGKTVVVVENPVDAMIAMHAERIVGCASTAGAGTWRPEWTDRVASARPDAVLVMLDNDLAGWPNHETWRSLAEAWMDKHPGKMVPEPAGPRLFAALDARPELKGRVLRHEWPPGTPVGADAGWRAGQGWRVGVA